MNGLGVITTQIRCVQKWRLNDEIFFRFSKKKKKKKCEKKKNLKIKKKKKMLSNKKKLF